MKIPPMKKLYFLVTALCCFNGLSATFINFPDAVLKNILISTNCVDNDNDGIGDRDADTNNDNEIDYNEASAINNLYLDGNIINPFMVYGSIIYIYSLKPTLRNKWLY